MNGADRIRLRAAVNDRQRKLKLKGRCPWCLTRIPDHRTDGFCCGQCARKTAEVEQPSLRRVRKRGKAAS